MIKSSDEYSFECNFFYAVEKIEAISIWHFNIEEHNIRIMFLYCLLTTGNGFTKPTYLYIGTILCQVVRQNFPAVFFIINNYGLHHQLALFHNRKKYAYSCSIFFAIFNMHPVR